jgi:hypothetical protein
VFMFHASMDGLNITIRLACGEEAFHTACSRTNARS